MLLLALAGLGVGSAVAEPLTKYTVMYGDAPAASATFAASAFYGLEELTEVSLPTGLKAIRSKAFAGCPKLTKPDIPAGCEVATDAFDQ